MLDKLRQLGEWDAVQRVVDAFVHKVELRATADHQVLAEIQLRATPLLRELMRVRQIVQKVALTIPLHKPGLRSRGFRRFVK